MKHILLLKHRFLSYATAPQQVNACWGDFPGKSPPTKRKILDCGSRRIGIHIGWYRSNLAGYPNRPDHPNHPDRPYWNPKETLVKPLCRPSRPSRPSRPCRPSDHPTIPTIYPRCWSRIVFDAHPATLIRTFGCWFRTLLCDADSTR